MFKFYRIANKHAALLLVMMLLVSFVQGQDVDQLMSIAESGIVTDNYGNPISNVTIHVKGQEKTFVTDQAGRFELDVEPGQVLVLSHPEYYTSKRKVKANDLSGGGFSVSLHDKYLKDPDQMDVLYGSMDKESFLGAASTIYTDQIASPLSSSVISSFAGRMAGLYVQQNSGFRSPNTTSNANNDLIGSVPVLGGGITSDNTMFSLNSRGMGPVVVVDGVQRELFSLDPENIESVSIQRDALSSIFLGMRSSRGVLLVTTKKPTDNQFQLSFTGRYGIQNSIRIPEPLSAYQHAYLLNEALQNDGNAPAYTYEDFEAFKNGTNLISHPNNNWYDILLEDNAPIQSYNLNVSGGGSVAKYYVSLGYFNQEGFFRTSGMNSYNTNMGIDRYIINSKLDVNITDELKLGVTIIGRIEEGNQPGSGYSGILDDIFRTPNGAYPVYNPDGSYGGNISFTNNLMSRTVNSGYISDESRDAIANIDLSYALDSYVKGLSFKAITNVSSQNKGAIERVKRSLVYEYKPGEDGEDGRYDPFGVLSSQNNNFVSVASARFWYSQAGFDYHTKIDKHNIEAGTHADINVVTSNYDLPQRPANIALRGRYNYDGKYFAEAAVTESYFNRYNEGDRWGTFYAFGLGWDVSRENFLKDVDWLNQFKLRAVYGKTGNGVDNSGYYVWRQTFRTAYFGDYSYPQGNNYTTGEGVVNNTLANPNISWEKGHKLNIGTDISLFNNRLQITGEYYRDNYFDLLQTRGRNVQLMGLGYPNENIGEKLFYGGELTVTYQDNIGDFNYFVTANWGQNSSEVLFVDEQHKPYEYNMVTGKPDAVRFGLTADGFFNSVDEIERSAVIGGFEIQPGDIKYKDLNNDGEINTFDFSPILGEKPLSYYGMTVGFNYKGVDFNVLLQGVYNREIYMGDNVFMAGFQGYGQSYGQAYSHMIERWTPETSETARFPRLAAGGNSYNMGPNGWLTSFWVESGDYLRVKDVYLAYTLPDVVCNQLLGGTKVKFFVSGQNLFTGSDVDLRDPEVEFRSYPLQRVLSTGINVKF